MIEKYGPYDYRLFCDYCEEACDEIFETFDDAVDYKTDKDNGWMSIKDRNGDWCELCPSCKAPEIVMGLKGLPYDAPVNTKGNKNIEKLANLSENAFEGF